jgi:ABC-type lipoprotein release transport system permease subunit
VLLPFLTGIAVSQGIEAEADASARFGADLYVTGSQFGRPVPIPMAAVARIEAIDGVTAVVPRIVGEVILGKDKVHAILVGLPPDHFSDWSACVEGELPRRAEPHELVVGTSLARQLNLSVGSMLLPFYRNNKGERLSRVVGVFKKDAPLWQAHLVLTTFETAATVFDQPDLATDLLVSCRPGYQAGISRIIEQDVTFQNSSSMGNFRMRVTAREDMLALLPRGLLHREGVFTLLFLVACVVCILVLLVTSGLGLTERRREIGILKATGWQTDEILLRGLAESLVLSIATACASLLLAWVWLRLFNGYGVVGLFIAGADVAPDFAVPFSMTPIPVLLAFVLSLVIVLSGTLYSSWRAATTSPREAMR